MTGWASSLTTILHWPGISPMPSNRSGYNSLKCLAEVMVTDSELLIAQCMDTRPNFRLVGSPKITGPSVSAT